MRRSCFYNHFSTNFSRRLQGCGECAGSCVAGCWAPGPDNCQAVAGAGPGPCPDDAVIVSVDGVCTEEEGLDTRTIVSIVSGVIVALLLLAISTTLLCCWCRRRQDGEHFTMREIVNPLTQPSEELQDTHHIIKSG